MNEANKTYLPWLLVTIVNLKDDRLSQNSYRAIFTTHVNLSKTLPNSWQALVLYDNDSDKAILLGNSMSKLSKRRFSLSWLY